MFATFANAAVGQFVRPDMLFEVLAGVDGAAGFQQYDVEAALSENFGSGAAGSSRPDDAHVINFGRSDYLHADIPRTACGDFPG
jgi:hypothetical protein